MYQCGQHPAGMTAFKDSTHSRSGYRWASLFLLRTRGSRSSDITANAEAEAVLVAGLWEMSVEGAAYGSHYLPLWLKASVGPVASARGLWPSHQPQLCFSWSLNIIQSWAHCWLLQSGQFAYEERRGWGDRGEWIDKCEKQSYLIINVH